MYLYPAHDTGYYTVGARPGSALTGVHDPALCEGRGCAVHAHPSDHPLQYDALDFEDGVMYRVCIHYIRHQDADDVFFRQQVGQHVEPCDCPCRCCVPPEPEEIEP